MISGIPVVTVLSWRCVVVHQGDRRHLRVLWIRGGSQWECQRYRSHPTFRSHPVVHKVLHILYSKRCARSVGNVTTGKYIYLLIYFFGLPPPPPFWTTSLFLLQSFHISSLKNFNISDMNREGNRSNTNREKKINK